MQTPLSWSRCDLKLADHSKHHEMIKTVQFALLEGRQVTGQYESPHESGAVKLHLHPYRLCLVKNAWYLIARPTGAEEPRTYRITRFKRLGMLNQPADVPDNFDLKRYFGNAWAVYRGDRTTMSKSASHLMPPGWSWKRSGTTLKNPSPTRMEASV